jgi:hypothetical protein
MIGRTRRKKIEVKEFKQTVLRVKHVKSAAPGQDNKPKAMSYVGTVWNTSNNCAPGKAAAIKLEFMAGADVARTEVLEAGTHHDAELAVGAYNIRLYLSDGRAWNFAQTIDHNVSKDGWSYVWGCDPPKPRR